MSTAAIKAGGSANSDNPVANPWLIALVVALASFMEVLDTTIANVALPYIAGGMGVSEDEADQEYCEQADGGFAWVATVACEESV